MLNVRSGPGTHYATTDKLYKGDLLVFLSMQGEWVKVENKRTKQIGYVFFKYVAVID
ncbi:SH3 domain-containing protein [Myroides phaeus]|uniref:SH3 domain-containing protein n=1 Tax=Myroides phaeus TaxID=702745 RepID=UPI00130389A8|nr:SH3 domain-containing protein [Myroides phaeus]